MTTLTMRDVREIKRQANHLIDVRCELIQLQTKDIKQLCSIIERQQAALKQYKERYWGLLDDAGLYGFHIDESVAREALLKEE